MGLKSQEESGSTSVKDWLDFPWCPLHWGRGPPCCSTPSVNHGWPMGYSSSPCLADPGGQTQNVSWTYAKWSWEAKGIQLRLSKLLLTWLSPLSFQKHRVMC